MIRHHHHTALVGALALFLTAGCADATDDDTSGSEDAFSVGGATPDPTFGSNGTVDTVSPLRIAEDGTFSGARVDNDFLVLERRAANGAPLATFESASARVELKKLSRPRAGWYRTNPPPMKRTLICGTGVEPNGTTYAVGYVEDTTPSGNPTYSGFVVIASADGQRIGGFAEGLGTPDYLPATKRPLCLGSARTGDGRLFVQFTIEPESMAGVRAIVPLDPAAHSLDTPGILSGDPNVLDYNAYGLGNTFVGPTLAIGDGKIVRGFSNVYNPSSDAGIQFQQLRPMRTLKRVTEPFRSVRADASAVTLLTKDANPRLISYDLAGVQTQTIALGSARPTNTVATDAVRDSTGRYWVVFDAVRSVAGTPSKRHVVRFLANGTRDVAFGTATLTGSAPDELMTSVQAQGTKLIVGSKTAAGLRYVRLQ